MNLHQFRFVQEAVRQNLNLTETAKVLFTSQPGISKAILELEEELGVDIFARHGKRLRQLRHPPGHPAALTTWTTTFRSEKPLQKSRQNPLCAGFF